MYRKTKPLTHHRFYAQLHWTHLPWSSWDFESWGLTCESCCPNNPKADIKLSSEMCVQTKDPIICCITKNSKWWEFRPIASSFIKKIHPHLSLKNVHMFHPHYLGKRSKLRGIFVEGKEKVHRTPLRQEIKSCGFWRTQIPMGAGWKLTSLGWFCWDKCI